MKKWLCLILLTALWLAGYDDVKPVSEWTDVFDIDCVCGNHLYATPCDLEHYKIVCKCGKVYEKGWDVWQKELDRWEYITGDTVDINKEGQTLIGVDETDPDVLAIMNVFAATLTAEDQVIKFIPKDYFMK